MRLGAVVLIVTTIVFAGCEDEPEQTPPVITSFEPTSGIAGTQITIHGGNFGEGPQVFLNDTPLELNEVADDQIKVTVTQEASTGKIRVVNNGAETVTSEDFTVLYTPTITAFSPNGGITNATVTITGTNFTDGTTVFFGDESAPIYGRTSTSISTIVPLHSYPAKIRITTPAGSVLSTELFIANPPAITSVKPLYSNEPLTVVSPGQVVIITTENYNVDAPKDIAFDGIPLLNMESTTSGILAEIPQGVQTGKFTITVNGHTVTYDPVITVISNAGEWKQSVEFPGSILQAPAGFKIGDYYYYGIGDVLSASYSGPAGPPSQEFWKFNPGTESWTQLPSFPATATWGSPSSSTTPTGRGTFSFGVDGQGYVSGGADYNFHISKEFYRFDPVSESWIKMADLSDELAQPYQNFGFSCNDKGYVFNITSGAVQEYDPDNDSWTPKGTIPGTLPVDFRSQFVSNNKAYIIVTRTNSTVNELWEYEPVGDTWTRKDDYPGATSVAFAFEIEADGYVGSSTAYFWKYDPSQGAWAQLPPMPKYVSGPAFSFGKKGYVFASTSFSFPNQGYSRLYTFQVP